MYDSIKILNSDFGRPLIWDYRELVLSPGILDFYVKSDIQPEYSLNNIYERVFAMQSRLLVTSNQND